MLPEVRCMLDLVTPFGCESLCERVFAMHPAWSGRYIQYQICVRYIPIMHYILQIVLFHNFVLSNFQWDADILLSIYCGTNTKVLDIKAHET